MFASFWSFIFTLFCLSAFVSAAAVPDVGDIIPTSTSEDLLSNAERIARRLPLAKPKRLFGASRSRALAPRASCMPQPGEYQLRVAKASDPNMYIGYVTGNGFDQGALTTEGSQAPIFGSPCNFDTQSQILSSSFSFNGSPYPYYMVRSPSGGDLGNGAGASAFGFTPDEAGDSGAQTTAFRIDATTKVVTVTYLNPSGIIGYPEVYNYQGTFFAGQSAATINAAYGLTLTEADKVIIVLDLM